MRIESILPTARKRLSTVQVDAAVGEAAKLLSDTHISLVVVCVANEVMVGVVTKTDIVRQIANCPGSGCTVAASAVMTRDVIYCVPSDSLHSVLSKMKEHALVHILVVKNILMSARKRGNHLLQRLILGSSCNNIFSNEL